MTNSKTPGTKRTVQEWRNLVARNVGSGTPEQIEAVAQRCFDADQEGLNSSVWHSAAMVTGKRCWCAECAPGGRHVRA